MLEYHIIFHVLAELKYLEILEVVASLTELLCDIDKFPLMCLIFHLLGIFSSIILVHELFLILEKVFESVLERPGETSKILISLIKDRVYHATVVSHMQLLPGLRFLSLFHALSLKWSQIAIGCSVSHK